MFLHVVEKVVVCSMLAKLNVNLKKIFREHFNKIKNLKKLILFSTSISHELETHVLLHLSLGRRFVCSGGSLSPLVAC